MASIDAKRTICDPSLPQTDDPKSHAGARYFEGLLHELGNDPERGLVVGCGPGHEACYLAQTTKGTWVGTDLRIADDVARRCGRAVSWACADAHALPFGSEVFDVVFYHHVIEHVRDPLRTLKEIQRVLRPGGLMFIGTPNRQRLVGYVGAYESTVRQKVAWNLADYRHRLTGRWSNARGAHAGFGHAELQGMVTNLFAEVTPLTRGYLDFKYGARIPPLAIRTVLWGPLMNVTAPAIYFLCRKTGTLSSSASARA